MKLQGLRLSPADPLRIFDGEGGFVRVMEGSVWITQEARLDDQCVEAGETVRLNSSGLTLVRTFTSALVTFTLSAGPRRSRVAARMRQYWRALQCDRVRKRDFVAEMKLDAHEGKGFPPPPWNAR
jgi:hypothetical protein